MTGRWLLAIATLPLPVTVLIPAGVLFLFRHSRWTHTPAVLSSAAFWLGATASIGGLALATWSVFAFARFGDGTPAPWDPPSRFVPHGPYRFVRNPMILGVFFILLGESLALLSWPLFAWFVLFALGNGLYIPFIEEKGLAKRFGKTYLQYKEQVPRWLPRRTAWQPGKRNT